MSYKVRWKGFGKEDDTWIGQKNLQRSAPAVIHKYLEKSGVDGSITTVTDKEIRGNTLYYLCEWQNEEGGIFETWEPEDTVPEALWMKFWGM